MKIALCFSGQPRGLKEAFEFYSKNLLSDNVDVFCHSWNSEFNDDILKLYRPKLARFDDVKFTVDDDSKYSNTPNPKKWPPRFTLSAYYSVNESLKLKQMYERDNNIKYDWVIKTRYDYAINIVLPLAELDNSKLYVPNCRMTPNRDFCNDQFAFSSSEIMDKYMSTYDHIQEFYDVGCEMIGEEMLKANLKKHNLIGENLVYVNMNNPFPPGPHNGTWHSLIREDYEFWTS